MPQKQHVMHGRDHMAGGADPIPDLGGGGAHVIQDEGTPLTDRAALNFVGAGVTATDDAGSDASKVTIPGAHVIQEEGTPLTARAALNFIGANVAATDDSANNRTNVTVSASVGGPPAQPGHRIGTTPNRWYIPGGGWSANLSTNSTTANRLELYPFIPSRNMTIDQVLIQVTGNVAGSIARIGMYTDDGNLYPASLLFDMGTVSTATTGVRQTAISQAVNAGQLYWVGISTSHATVQLRAMQAGSMMVILGWAQASGTPQPGGAFGWFLTHTTSTALPNPLTAGATPMTATDGVPTAIFLRGV